MSSDQPSLFECKLVWKSSPLNRRHLCQVRGNRRRLSTFIFLLPQGQLQNKKRHCNSVKATVLSAKSNFVWLAVPFIAKWNSFFVQYLALNSAVASQMAWQWFSLQIFLTPTPRQLSCNGSRDLWRTLALPTDLQRHSKTKWNNFYYLVKWHLQIWLSMKSLPTKNEHLESPGKGGSRLNVSHSLTFIKKLGFIPARLPATVFLKSSDFH